MSSALDPILTKDLAPETCLGPTKFIDSDHQRICEQAKSLTSDTDSHPEKAAAMFQFVREQIPYEFMLRVHTSAFVASNILEERRGFCVRKAVLLTALARSAGIPSALVFCDMRDHTLPQRLTDAMGTDIMYHHGLNAFFLDGHWRLADATLSTELVERLGSRATQFDGAGDALLPAHSTSGQPHTEILHFHGMYADLPFQDMLSGFAQGYANADIEALANMGYRL